MFLHIENQHILLSSLQKTPYLVEFTEKYPGYKDNWFRGIIEQFYTKWIDQGHVIPQSASELLEMNKQAIHYMIGDLKRILGYTYATLEIPKYSSVLPNYASYPLSTPIHASSPLPSPSPSSELNWINGTNVADEKKMREDHLKSQFSQYQNEYMSLLAKPNLPTYELPQETADTKIRNMDELIMEQTRMRDMDLAVFSPPQPIKSTYGNSMTPTPVIAPPPSQQSSSQPKLKIMNIIEQVDLSTPVNMGEDLYRNTKTVSWKDEEELSSA